MGMLGANGIVGAVMLISTGAACAAKHEGKTMNMQIRNIPIKTSKSRLAPAAKM
jgi:hypothetical protein